jgi:hypothetical protein
MRKFTYRDIVEWKVVTFGGKELSLYKKDKDGKTVTIARWDGFRSANQAALRLGGNAVRV